MMKEIRDYQNRKNRILSAIVDSFVATAEPVSSRAVCKRTRLNLSTATVRNIMADLEEEGFIAQPHTSAGRVPTDKGYRLYVDELMQAENPAHSDVEKIKNLLFRQEQISGLDNIIGMVSSVLADLSNQISFVLYPRLNQVLFKHVELIALDADADFIRMAALKMKSKILVVLISSTGVVKTSVIHLDDSIRPELLEKLANFINSECFNLPLNKIESHLRQIALNQSHGLYWLAKTALEIIKLSNLIVREERLVVDGTRYILDKPEFHNWQKTKSILNAIEEQSEILEILENNLEEGTRIYIGSENPYSDMQSCSFVAAAYKISGKPSGSLGVIGPTRMEYPRIVCLVNYVSETLNELLS